MDDLRDSPCSQVLSVDLYFSFFLLVGLNKDKYVATKGEFPMFVGNSMKMMRGPWFQLPILFNVFRELISSYKTVRVKLPQNVSEQQNLFNNLIFPVTTPSGYTGCDSNRLKEIKRIESPLLASYIGCYLAISNSLYALQLFLVSPFLNYHSFIEYLHTFLVKGYVNHAKTK